MKYLKCLIIIIVSVLIFSTSNCFAIEQNLIDGMEAYEIAVNNLRKIEIKLETANDEPKYWLNKLGEEKNKKGVFYSSDMMKFYQNKIVKSRKEIIELSIKHNKAKKEVKKLEPIVDEYNKQVEIERKRENFKGTIIHLGKIIGLPIAFLVLITFLSKLMAKRYRRLLKKGKITQDEYDQIMSDNSKSRLFDDNGGVNPATGLPLVGIGISDAGGNVRGSSSTNGFSDSSQDYRERHRWD